MVNQQGGRITFQFPLFIEYLIDAQHWIMFDVCNDIS